MCIYAIVSLSLDYLIYNIKNFIWFYVINRQIEKCNKERVYCIGDGEMNFCVECGSALEGTKEECLNCGFIVADVKKRQSKLEPTVQIKLKELLYEGIINLISLIQVNFYLSFIGTFILFIIFSTKPSLGWGMFLIILFSGYLYADSKEVIQHPLDYKIQLWFANKVKLTPSRIEHYSKNDHRFIQTIKSKKETPLNKADDSEATVGLKVHEANQGIENELNSPDPIEIMTHYNTKQGAVNQLELNQVVKYIMHILLIAIALFVYYRGLVAYSLYDVKLSLLSESYQQQTLTMSELIDLLSYGHYFDNTSKSEIIHMTFFVIAYYLPVGFAFLSLLPSKLAGFCQLIIAFIMGGGMLYLVYLANDSNLLVTYSGQYSNFSAGLGLGSFFIFGAIIFMIILSVVKMFSTRQVVRSYS